MSNNVAKWNVRRVELTSKQRHEMLNQHEERELDLVTRVVDSYIRKKIPGQTLESIERFAREVRR